MKIITTPLNLGQVEKLCQMKVFGLIFPCDLAVQREHKFDLSMIKEAKKICDQYQVECYLLINRQFKENELSLLDEYFSFCKQNALDGIYFSDLALVSYARKYQMVDKLIYDTHLLMTNKRDIDFMLALGIKRVVIASALSYQESVQMNLNQCELVICGHLNLSYSARKLLDCYFDQIEVTREKDIYEIEEETRNERFIIYQDDSGTGIYEKKVFYGSEYLQNEYLRVDTLFMSEGYVEDLIDALINQHFELLKEKYPNIEYSRGFMDRRSNITK